MIDDGLSVSYRSLHGANTESKHVFVTPLQQIEDLFETVKVLELGFGIGTNFRLLRQIIRQVMSYHDFSGAPEKVYHALTLGMLVWLTGKYDIRSNRESGYGRYDILLKPKDIQGVGVVIEFKLVDSTAATAHEQVLAEALKQIEVRGYATELTAAGIKDILEIAVAFRGKELWVSHRRSHSA